MKYRNRMSIRALAFASCVLSVEPALAQSNVNIQPVVTGLSEPWAIAPLPGGGVLITQRSGELILHNADGSTMVKGVPRIEDDGQGGLLDITLARDFDQTRSLFLTYAKNKGAAVASLWHTHNCLRMVRDLRT